MIKGPEKVEKILTQMIAQIIEDYLVEEYQVKGTFSPDKAGTELASIISDAVVHTFSKEKKKES